MQTQYNASVMGHLQGLLHTGQFDAEQVAKRQRRAQDVLRNYDIAFSHVGYTKLDDVVEFWTVTNTAGRAYTVHVYDNGQAYCSCPDNKFRAHNVHAGLCKHSLATLAIRNEMIENGEHTEGAN